VANEGAEVWVSWSMEHGFGLADGPDTPDRTAGTDRGEPGAVRPTGDVQAMQHGGAA
jgi:spermidine/putrescine transport system ATP-binding protein